MEAPVDNGSESSPSKAEDGIKEKLLNPGTGVAVLIVIGLVVYFAGVPTSPQQSEVTTSPSSTTSPPSPSVASLAPMWQAVEHLESAYGESVDRQELAEAAIDVLVAVSGDNLGSQDLDEPVPDDVPDGFEEVWRLWYRIEREGLEVESRDLMVLAMRAMVETTGDPEAAILVDVPVEPDGYVEDVYYGIGAFVVPVEGFVVIGQTFPGGPASDAGIRPGDVLKEVDGVSVVGLPLDEVVDLVRGPAGTTVSLVFERARVDPVEVEVIRESLELGTARFSIHPGGIGYLSVTSLDTRTPAEVEEELGQLSLRDIRALILDLRGNPGGRPSAALSVADQFLDGELVYLEEALDGTATAHQAEAGGLAIDLPLAILIDEGTAGEAELLAAALRHYELGPLLGVRSGGQAALHRGYELGDGMVIVARSGRWLAPGRRAVEPEGLSPDQQIELRPEDVAGGFDRQQAVANAYLWSLLEGTVEGEDDSGG